MTRAVVFLGPTLPADEAATMLDAVILPPAAVGDVHRAVRRKPDTIVLVDGFFERVPAVWHKEILYALSRGIAVVGCASMGALRAAELHRYGMLGWGTVFERYRDGVYDDDDEVAVAHTDAGSGYRHVSEAMVNIRHGLTVARDRGIIGDNTRRVLEESAKAEFYPDRHWSSVIETGTAGGLPRDELSDLFTFVREHRPDLKRADAAETLGMLAESRIEPPDPLPFEFEPTHGWRRLRRMESNTPT